MNASAHSPLKKSTGPQDKPVILVIDDEESMRDSCSQILKKEGLRTETAENGLEGLDKIKALEPDLVLIDLKMPGMNGMEVLEELIKIDPTCIPVVITGYATVDSAVEAMKIGAYDFLPKPFTPDQLRLIIRRGIERRKLIQETESLRQEKKLMEENFITMVSHQLRSPLVTIMQYYEVILGGMAGEVPEKQKEIIQKSKARLDGLLNLINDWLDVARLDSGQIVDNLKPVSAKKIITKVIEDLQPLAQEEKISMEFGSCSEDDLVQGDSDTLEQVFANIITNAIRYNRPSGKVTISIKENEKYTAVEFRDTGIGIASKHLPFLFDQFFRAKRGENHKVKGTGLGLSIAKKIVDAHGGSIQVSSQPNKGSTFTVLLPKPKSEKKARRNP